MKRFTAPSAFSVLALTASLLLTGCSEGARPECHTETEEFIAEKFYKYGASTARSSFYNSDRSSGLQLWIIEQFFAPELVAHFSQQTSTWPIHIKEKIREIEITGYSFSENCLSVTLSTIESWEITSDEKADFGSVKFQETQKPHQVVMEKRNGLPPYQVVAISGL